MPESMEVGEDSDHTNLDLVEEKKKKNQERVRKTLVSDHTKSKQAKVGNTPSSKVSYSGREPHHKSLVPMFKSTTALPEEKCYQVFDSHFRLERTSQRWREPVRTVEQLLVQSWEGRWCPLLKGDLAGRLIVNELNWLFNVTLNDISVIYVQADRKRSWTYGRAPNAIDISYGSLTCPSKHRHGAILFIRLFRETAPFSRLLRHTEDTFSTLLEESWFSAIQRPFQFDQALKWGYAIGVHP